MTAKLVTHPYTQNVTIPAEMGSPRNDQMQGNKLEQLAELTGRICYDSLGKGRNSEDYHQHIIESGHHGVYRGSNILIEYIDPEDIDAKYSYCMELINRPGFHFKWPYLSLNPSCVLGWHKHQGGLKSKGGEFQAILAQAMPLAFGRLNDDRPIKHNLWKDVQPQTDLSNYFKWYSFYLSGSRYFSHEQVRHSWHSGLGQRSTRYCNETDAKPIRHPYMNDAEWADHQDCFFDSTEGYRELRVRAKSRGLDHKQSAGVARFELLGSCETEMIFSASLDQWYEMIRQRMSPFAEVEIRLIYNEVYNAIRELEILPEDLQATEKASDGCGFVLSR